MKEAGVNVPDAILLEKDMDEEDIEFLLKPFYNHSLVVKPRNTNYGTGITVFAKASTKKQIINAVNYAFEFDNNVLIEEYVKGMEYRFLVVNGKCLSVALIFCPCIPLTNACTISATLSGSSPNERVPISELSLLVLTSATGAKSTLKPRLFISFAIVSPISLT